MDTRVMAPNSRRAAPASPLRWCELGADKVRVDESKPTKSRAEHQRWTTPGSLSANRPLTQSQGVPPAPRTPDLADPPELREKSRCTTFALGAGF